MYFDDMILNSDGGKVIEAQVTKIKEAVCNNCGNQYNDGKKITFVELEVGKIIWWHRQGFCNKKHKIVNNRLHP